MFPALMAAEPLIKYGVMIGVPIILLSASYTAGCVKGECNIQEAWDTARAQQAAQAVQDISKQVIAVDAMESKVSIDAAALGRELEQKAQTVKQKVTHVAKKPIPLSVEFVRVYDELRRLPNEAVPDGLSSTNPDAGGTQVSRGEVPTASAQLVQVETPDGEFVGLTTDELKLAIADAYRKFAEINVDYYGADRWNAGREELELKRQGGEERHE